MHAHRGWEKDVFANFSLAAKWAEKQGQFFEYFLVADKTKIALLWAITGGLLLGIAAIVAITYEQYRVTAIIATAEVATDCDLHSSACTVTIPGRGEVSLSLQPRPVPVLEKLTINVQTRGLDVKGVAVDFKGVGMKMGVDRIELKHGGSNSYYGDGMLPVCIRNRMEWRANIMIQTGEGVLVAPFPLATNPR